MLAYANLQKVSYSRFILHQNGIIFQHEKIQKLLFCLGNQEMEIEHQLAIVTKIRQEISTNDVFNDTTIEQIVENTAIVTMVCQILHIHVNPNQHSSLVRYLKLEALWILANLSFSKEEHILFFFDKQYNFVSLINEILDGNDVQMID